MQRSVGSTMELPPLPSEGEAGVGRALLVHTYWPNRTPRTDQNWFDQRNEQIWWPLHFTERPTYRVLRAPATRCRCPLKELIACRSSFKPSFKTRPLSENNQAKRAISQKEPYRPREPYGRSLRNDLAMVWCFWTWNEWRSVGTFPYGSYFGQQNLSGSKSATPAVKCWEDLQRLLEKCRSPVGSLKLSVENKKISHVEGEKIIRSSSAVLQHYNRREWHVLRVASTGEWREYWKQMKRRGNGRGYGKRRARS